MLPARHDDDDDDDINKLEIILQLEHTKIVLLDFYTGYHFTIDIRWKWFY